MLKYSLEWPVHREQSAQHTVIVVFYALLCILLFLPWGETRLHGYIISFVDLMLKVYHFPKYIFMKQFFRSLLVLSIVVIVEKQRQTPIFSNNIIYNQFLCKTFLFRSIRMEKYVARALIRKSQCLVSVTSFVFASLSLSILFLPEVWIMWLGP